MTRVDRIDLLLFLFLVVPVVLLPSVARPWSNGGPTAPDDYDDPNYGTHDWIAQHAYMLLPGAERVWIVNHIDAYLLGTEAPDFETLHYEDYPSYGDQWLHHNYYDEGCWMILDGHDCACLRAKDEYGKADSCLSLGDEEGGAYYAGAMTHYISDVGVFGHVMGAASRHPEEVHHEDYEYEANWRTNRYNDGYFEDHIVFDGWDDLTAYRLSFEVGMVTDCGDTATGGETMDCRWMDDNYDWDDPRFFDSVGASLNRSVNAVADALHRLSVANGYATAVSKTSFGMVKAGIATAPPKGDAPPGKNHCISRQTHEISTSRDSKPAAIPELETAVAPEPTTAVVSEPK